MKKLLSLALCLIMLLSVALMSCDNTDNQTNETSAESTSAETTSAATTSDETSAPVIPDGYKVYNDGYISFAYPDTWSKENGSVVTLSKSNGNNITVVYEDKTDYYEKMTTAIFRSDLKPVYESMGMTISGEKVEQTTNNSGTKITKVSYTAIVNGVSMNQTAYITTIGNRTYTVTVTEVTPDTALANNVFNSLTALK